MRRLAVARSSPRRSRKWLARSFRSIPIGSSYQAADHQASHVSSLANSQRKAPSAGLGADVLSLRFLLRSPLARRLRLAIRLRLRPFLRGLRRLVASFPTLPLLHL